MDRGPLMTTARNVWPGQTLINIPNGGDGHWQIVSIHRRPTDIRIEMHDRGTGRNLSIEVDPDTPLQIERWEDK